MFHLPWYYNSKRIRDKQWKFDKKIKQIPLAHIAFHTVENESTTLLEFICVYFSFLGFLLLQVLTIEFMGG